MEKKKPPKKADIEMPEDLLTIKQVTEFTNVPRDTLIHYDKKGLLKPIRTGDTANNRRLYSKDHLERLKKILVLRSYGFAVEEIGLILDEDFSNLTDMLEERVEELRLEMNRLRNMILFFKFINISNSDFVDGIMFGPADIDALANLVRKSSYYTDAMERIKSYSDEDWDAVLEELVEIVYELISLDEDEGFDEIAEYIDRFCEWWSKNIASLDHAGFMEFWALFEDNSIIFYALEELGDESTAGYIQMHAFFVWMKRLMTDGADLVRSIGEYAESDVVCALERLEEFRTLVCKRMMTTLLDPKNGSGDDSEGDSGSAGDPGNGSAGDSGNADEGDPEGDPSSGSKDDSGSADEDGEDEGDDLSEDDLLESALDYMERILDDNELVEYIDPRGEIGMDAEDIRKARTVFDAIRT